MLIASQEVDAISNDQHAAGETAGGLMEGSSLGKSDRNIVLSPK